MSKPILFSKDMVRAILDGEKTQSRRVIKPQPGQRDGADYVDGVWYESDWYGDSHKIRCPYGKPGDQLWVREAAYISPAYFCSSADATHFDYENAPRMVDYPATMSSDAIRVAQEYGIKKTPSIFMPQWASRITLEIVDVRAERLHAINYDDVEAEGVGYVEGITPDYWVKPWADLWNSINAKRGYGFDTNPWVWVVQFERINEK